MSRSPLLNISTTICGRVADNALTLLLFGVAARFLGREAFGSFLVVLSLASLIAFVSDFGLARVAMLRGAANDLSAVSIYREAIFLRTVLSVAAAIVAILISLLVMDSLLMVVVMASLLAGVIFFAVGDCILDVYRMLEDALPSMWCNLGYKVILTVFGIVSLLVAPLLQALAWAYVLAGAVYFVGVLYLFRRSFSVFPFAVPRVATLALLKESWPYGCLNLVGMLNVRVPLYLVAWFIGAEASGLFGAAHRLVEALLFVPIAIQSVVLPNFVRHLVRWPTLQAPSATIGKLLFAVSAPIAVTVALNCAELTALLYGAGFDHSAPVLQIVIWYVVFTYAVAVLVAALQAAGRIRSLLAVATVVLVAHGSVGAVATYHAGVIGSASSMVGAELFSLGICLWVASDIVPLSSLISGSHRIMVALVPMAVAQLLAADLPVLVRVALGGVAYLLVLWRLPPLNNAEMRWLREARVPARSVSDQDATLSAVKL